MSLYFIPFFNLTRNARFKLFNSVKAAIVKNTECFDDNHFCFFFDNLSEYR